MRVISGNFSGRVFKAPAGHKTHPMSEKIRGAIFNALGDIEGLTFLDAFSGTGAIAIEALSRGAKNVTAIDVSKDAYSVISDNFKSLGILNAKVIRANCSSWSDNNQEMTFDIVVCDPPYEDTQLKTINKLERHIVKNGLLILSLPPGATFETSLKLELEKDYNDAKLYIYRKP